MLADVDALNYTHVMKLCYDIPMVQTHTQKVGKPRTRPDAVLDKILNTRLAADEYETIFNAANREGLSVSQYVRNATLGTAVADPETRETVFTAAGSAIPDPAQTSMDISLE